MMASLGLRPEDVASPDDLPRLPILAKTDVTHHAADLRARALPNGEKIFGPTHSSGTTGRSVEVWHGYSSNLMFTLLALRGVRWHDQDPMRSRVTARIPAEVRHANGSRAPTDVLTSKPHWHYVGQLMETGPEYTFSITNPMERQIAWLREVRPSYVTTYPGTLEEWALAAGSKPVDSVEQLSAISAQLTPALRKRLERVYGVPIHQGYGLNEIGRVAIRCDAGRYHVHTEHCLVEIVDAAGRPCAPHETGRVLVTGLRNFAMPLLRYDTGDLAEVVTGPCPCGRTLPSFGEIAGRFVRFAGLPPRTRQRFYALIGAFESLSAEQLAFLRRHQIHQNREDRFELRLVTAGPVPNEFHEHVQRAWAAVAGDPPEPLTILEVADVARSPSGKSLDFTSHFHTDPYANPNAVSNNDDE
jgi:phenylacetate-CoA ligase